MTQKDIKQQAILKTAYIFVVVLVPFVAVANSNQVGTIGGLIDAMLSIVNPLIALLTGFAVLAFVRGIAVFIWQADNEEKRKEGKKFLIWGIVGLFVLFSFWGAIYFVQTFYFGTGVGTPFYSPQLGNQKK